MIHISLSSGGDLRLHFPSHSVTIPFTYKGMSALRAVLMAHEKRPDAKIATAGAPTQWDIDQWLRAHPPARTIDLDINLDL